MDGACVQAITEQQFDQEVLKESRAVLVDFYTVTCPPCKLVAPVLEDLCAANSASLKVVKVDAMQSRKLAMDHQIQAVPTLVLYRGGKRIAQRSGAASRPVLEAWVQSALR